MPCCRLLCRCGTSYGGNEDSRKIQGQSAREERFQSYSFGFFFFLFFFAILHLRVTIGFLLHILLPHLPGVTSFSIPSAAASSMGVVMTTEMMVMVDVMGDEQGAAQVAGNAVDMMMEIDARGSGPYR